MGQQNLKQMINQWLNGVKKMKSETIFKRIFAMWRVVMMVVVLLTASTAHATISAVQLEVLADGVAPFDATDGPGLDSSATNGIVRTFDRITYRITYSSTSTANSKFVFTLPSGSSWDSTSTAASLCNGAGGGSISGTTLTCNRIPVVGTESFNIYAYANTRQNNSIFQPTVSVDGAANVLAAPLTISAVPKASTRTYNNNLIPKTINGVSGYQYDMNVGIGITGTTTDVRGAESRASVFTYQISVMPGAYLANTCSICSQPGGPGTPITVTRSSNIDFNLSPGPAFFTPATGSAPYFFTLQVFTPIDPNNTPADVSDDNFPLGSTSYAYSQMSGFDPQSVSGQSNFGTGYSPEMDPTYVCSKNTEITKGYACASLKIDRTQTVPLIQPIFSVVSEQSSVQDPIYADSNTMNNGDYAYSESVLPGQPFMAYAGLYSDIKGFGTTSNTGQCFLFDNSLVKLNAAPTVKYGDNVSIALTATQLLTGSDLVLEYTSQAFASDAVRKATNCGVAGNGDSGWSTDAAAVGGLSAVTAVRYKYTKPLNVSAGLVLAMPLERTTNASSLALTDGTVIPWFWHNNYTTDPDSVVHYDFSNYAAGTGPAQRGGRITTQPIKVHETTVIGSSSIAPSTQTSVTITPRMIGAAVAGVDAVAKNVVVTAKFQDNCVVPVESSLPSNATFTAGNYGADGIPCTSDDGAAGTVSFAVGDVTVAGGTAVAPYGGATVTLTPITFNAVAVATSSTSTKVLTTTIASTNDLTPLFVGADNTEDRTERVNVVINGAAAFSAAKTTTGVTGGKVGPNEIFGYTINFGNGGSTNSGVGYFVDVLPFDGDDNGTTGLGAGKFEITSLAASMSTSAMGTVTIQYSTDASASVQAAIKVAGQENGSTGINWTTYTTGSTIPAGVTALRFITSSPMLIGYSGSATINLKAPTINSTTSFTNTVWARTDLYQGDPSSAQVIRSGSAVTIQGLDPSTLRGRVFLDTNANGTYDAGESGLTSTIVKIQCTAGACLTAPQGTVFSMVVDAAGGYAFAPNATGIFASADGSGTALSAFQGVLSGTWDVTETPPSTPATAISTTSVGTINGTTSGTASGRSITNVAMVSSGIGINYNFAERFLDGTIEVTKALTLPAGITGPLSFEFTATCDLPVANTKKSATLSNYPTNTTVSITGIAAGATCTLEETLPASPDNKYYWETPVFSALSPATMANGGTQSVTATNKLSPTVTIAKTVTSAPTAVSGKPTQFDTTYRLTVSNVSSAAQTYDLADTFGFDSDVTVVGTPTIVKSSNVSGTVNSAFTGSSSSTSIITGESIAAGSTATPTTETYDVAVRVNVPAGSSTTNNTCSGTTSGQGLFNTAVLSMSGATDQSATACSSTPTVSGVNLVLQKTWVNATAGESVTIPATTGFSANTAAFDAAAAGSNTVSSGTVVVAANEIGTLPTETFATTANAINYSTSAWSCSDGTNAAITVAQGGNLTVPSTSVGQTLTCTLTNTSVVDGVTVAKSVTAGPTIVSGTGDQFDITYRVTVSNTNTTATGYSLSDTFGFDSDATVVGTPTIVKSSNVSGTVNSAFTGSGANTSIVSSESIAAGSVATPTVETYDISTRVKVSNIGSTSNDTCTSSSGNGLFNNAQMTVAGTVKQANACSPPPSPQTAQLTFKVEWSGATVGESLSVPASTGLTTNTAAFNAVSTGSNTVSSATVSPVIGETATLPTPAFATAGNEIFYGSPTSWACSDGVNPDVTVPFGSTLNFGTTYLGQSVVCKVLYTSVVSGVNVTKAVTAGPTAASGTLDQFDITYRVSVTNTNTTATAYSLSDVFGFDSDVSVVGTPSIVKSANVAGTVNSVFTGSGTNTSIVSNESIAAGSAAAPTEETYDITVRVKVAATGSTSNNACTSSTGNGLFNNAQMSIAGTVKEANACGVTPTLQTSQLSLQVDWANATVGETLNVPSTTGLSSNTAAFNSVSTGSNSVSSNTVVPVIGETATLPTPAFANTNNALNYVVPTNWSCSDGVNQSVSVPFGGNLTFSNTFSGASVLCKAVYSGVQVDTVKTASPAAGTSVAAGDTIQYTLKTTVSGNATQRDVLLSDTLGTGLTVGTLPAGCTVTGQKIACTLASGASIGEHTFTYNATVNESAATKVTNQVTTDVGTCSSCSVSHPLWSVVTNKTSDASAKKNVRIGDTINYTVTSTVAGGASTRDVVLKDTLGTGLTLTSVPSGCSASGSNLSCTIPSGSAAGNYVFTYGAIVNAQAQSTVVNTVSPSYGLCTTCSTSSVVIKDVGLLITKTAKTKSAKIGDFVRYEVVIENPSKFDANDFSLVDQPAPGLSYVAGSMNVVGDSSFTVTAEYPLTTSNLDVSAGQKLTLSYIMRVGASAGQGSLENCAQASDTSSAITSNRSCASITRTSDPDFEDSRILGTVFEDSNGNGMQDDGEPGIPGVRLATVEGLLIETDAYGRYHIEGINPGQWARGSNFIVKVDLATVPEGAVPTTQNPLVKRLTQGLPGLFNFGFRVPFSTYEPGKPLSYPVMLSADGLFEFDRFDLLDAGRNKLADLAKQLLEDSKIQKGLKVSAYTDRLGSDAYNQKLSTKRAETIKAFLVSQGVAENLITIEGMGAAKPLVNCSGNKSASVIACLAPNRRFEVSLP